MNDEDDDDDDDDDDDGRWGFMGTLFSGKAILQDLRSLKEPRR